MGTVEVEGNHQVTVTVPHVEGAGTAQTVFKGNHKPVAKECILIIDHTTGEIVLERISQAIIVKTTRYLYVFFRYLKYVHVYIYTQVFFFSFCINALHIANWISVIDIWKYKKDRMSGFR